jgi:malonate decarboxylase epsilon subunit
VIAFLFPGQGAQRPGFLHTFDHPEAVATLKEASDILKLDILTLDSENALRSTVAVQVTLVTAAVAAARALSKEGIEPDAVAGLSIGAYGAAVVAQAITFADALPLVQLRAQLMESAYPQGYGMLALIGLSEQEVIPLLQNDTYLANLNAPRQIVVAGNNESLERLRHQALQHGARKAEPIAINVPSHCILLDAAARELTEAASKVPLQPPRIPYIGNRRARVLHDAEAIREDLATNLRYPVRWHESTIVLSELGMRVLVEMPPGRTLTQLATEALPDTATLAIDTTPIPSAAARIRSRLATP